MKDFHTKYPGLKWLFPFSPLIPKNYQPQSIQGKNLLVSVNDGTLVEVTDPVKGLGYCVDYFNPNSTQFLDEIFTDNNFDFTIDGFWLYHNTPYFSATNYTGKAVPPEIDPF